MRQRPLIQSPPKPKSTRSVCIRAYVWVYSTTPYSARKTVVYDFSPSRAGEHAPNFLGPENGKLICDDFAVYKPVSRKASLKLVKWPTTAASLDLYVANKSQLAEQALHSISDLMDVIEKIRRSIFRASL